jgi:hypothetical protein
MVKHRESTSTGVFSTPQGTFKLCETANNFPALLDPFHPLLHLPTPLSTLPQCAPPTQSLRTLNHNYNIIASGATQHYLTNHISLVSVTFPLWCTYCAQFLAPSALCALICLLHFSVLPNLFTHVDSVLSTERMVPVRPSKLIPIH